MLALPAAGSAQTASIDLLTGSDQQLVGADGGLDARDMDGDGDSDLVVGTPAANTAYMVAGSAAARIELSSLVAPNWVVSGRGLPPTSAAGQSVAGVGDVNGDGVQDLALTAPGNRTAYVVFGDAFPGIVELTRLGTGGFNADGFSLVGFGAPQDAYTPVRANVAAAGDVNRDGLGDLLVGDPYAYRPGYGPEDPFPPGAAYLVFGKASLSPVNLTALGAAGYVMRAGPGGGEVGYSVADAGDVDRDGRPDHLIGQPGAAGGAGSAYVVFGRAAGGADVDLSALGARGYRIDGVERPDQAGAAVANAGDLNGDGRPDALIGAPLAGADLSGVAYVVYGSDRTSTVSLASLGRRGFAMRATYPAGAVGGAVAGTGDLNGDGWPDLAIGAPDSHVGDRWFAGSVYVVYGRRRGGDVDLMALGDRGIRIDGADDWDRAGSSVTGNGDFDSNPASPGRDLQLGAPDATGAIVYVVHGAGIVRRATTPIRLKITKDSVVRYRTALPARIQLRLIRLLPGRTSGPARPGGKIKCTATTRRAPGTRPCLRRVVLGAISRVHRRAGSFSFRIPSRLRGRQLRPGPHQIIAIARSARGSGHQVVPFRIGP